MGFNSAQSTSNSINLRYSAFVGMLYISNPETEQLMKEAKALVGEAEVKKGYKGYKGDSASAKAIAFLRKNNLYSGSVSGILHSARVIERESDGRPYQYLNVCLRDGQDMYYVSVELNQNGAQMLARKLANAQPGVFTEVGMFATYGQRDGAEQPYADHGCFLRQGFSEENPEGSEVKGIDPQEHLVPAINAALARLEDAGISRSDKETYAKRRASVELEYHLDLMTSVTQMFTDFYGQREPKNDAAYSQEKAA
jgi:hypothetical protein